MTGISNQYTFIPTFKSQQAQEDAIKAAAEKARLKEQEEAKKKAKEAAERKAAEQELEMMKQELENSEKQAEAAEESFAAFAKCLVIARRISHGDKVPTKDMKFLMENEPDLYKQSIMLRQPNDKPKKYKSVLDEEDEESSENVSAVSESQSASEIVSESFSETAAPTETTDTAEV